MIQIKYKHGMTYTGPRKHKPKWLSGLNIKKGIATHLKAHQAQYPQYWNQAHIKPVVPVTEPKCTHQLNILTRGNWGPHRAKRVCVDCGAWIKWEKTTA